MRVRVASVSFSLSLVKSFDEFADRYRSHVWCAADNGARLVVFPEFVTAPLLGLNGAWDYWTVAFQELARGLAKEFGIYLMAGTHPERVGGEVRNVASLFEPSGLRHLQAKLHLTPIEKGNWSFQEGEELVSISTEIGQLAILTCYDVEFPEAVRAAARAGVECILVPSWTEDAHGFSRVSLCARARCIENQLYAVHAPLTGALAGMRGFEQAVGKAGVYSPCDISFPKDGIVVEGNYGQTMCAIGDIDLGLLRDVRQNGSVTPFLDVRTSGYRVQRSLAH